MDPLAIIGSGLAGYTLAREFRRLDKERPLVIVTADDGRFYSKPMLSNALAQRKEVDALAMSDAGKMAEDLSATVRTATTVAGINTKRRELTIGEQTMAYGQLVLAVGALPIAQPLGGNAADCVLAVNNLSDYGRFRERLEGARRVVILGPGLIGCEFANDLVLSGYEVTVVGPDATPLDRLLPEAAGEALQRALADVGVQWRLGLVAESVDRVEDGLVVGLSDGSHLEADLVLSAIGLRPNTALAEQAGLQCNRGIVVDRRLQTSEEDVYALGDCMEIESHVLPFVMPIMHAARALAKTLAGEPTTVSFPAMPVVVKTPSHPVVVAPPRPGAGGQWEVDIGEDGVQARFLDADGHLLGFALTGAYAGERQKLTRELPPLLP
jgi:rubredoxin-NAD+ reductase